MTDYYSKNRYTGNGSTTNRNLTFAFLSREHVKVYINGNITVFSWINDSEVQISPAPAHGQQIEIRRETPKTSRLVDWQDGSGLTEEDMDLADLQVLYIAQEAFDTATDALPISISDLSAWDAGNKRIVNVGAAIQNTDAVNKGQVISLTSQSLADIEALHDETETLRDEAVLARNAAQSAQSGAETAENNAEGHETGAIVAQLAAEAAASQAIAAAAEGLFNKTISLSISDSPYTPLGSDEGALYVINTSGGNIVINLSSLATYAEDMKFGFVKETGDVNTVTINRGGSNTIDGNTSKVLSDTSVIMSLIGSANAGKWFSSLGNTTVADASIGNVKLANTLQNRVKGRASSGSGSPEDLTLTQVLDMVGSAAHGDILYRGTSGWEKLSAGTADSLFQTKGAGQNPAYVSLPEVRQIPQNSQSSNYTVGSSDGGGHVLHPAADTTNRTFTIPANATLAFPIGTAITFVNQNGTGGVITIAITSDTMRLAGAGTTGNRTLARNGVATALKITATEWIISGTGLT